jgi:hypothetical protein
VAEGNTAAGAFELPRERVRSATTTFNVAPHADLEQFEVPTPKPIRVPAGAPPASGGSDQPAAESVTPLQPAVEQLQQAVDDPSQPGGSTAQPNAGPGGTAGPPGSGPGGGSDHPGSSGGTGGAPGDAAVPERAHAVTAAAPDRAGAREDLVSTVQAVVAAPDPSPRVLPAPRATPLPERAIAAARGARSTLARPPSTPSGWRWVIATLLLTGAGALAALIARQRRAGGAVTVEAVPVAPLPMPPIDELAIEAELQELVAEAKASELAARDGEEHARDGPLVGSRS